jgi:hypothetical protein
LSAGNCGRFAASAASPVRSSYVPSWPSNAIRSEIHYDGPTENASNQISNLQTDEDVSRRGNSENNPAPLNNAHNNDSQRGDDKGRQKNKHLEPQAKRSANNGSQEAEYEHDCSGRAPPYLGLNPYKQIVNGDFKLNTALQQKSRR